MTVIWHSNQVSPWAIGFIYFAPKASFDNIKEAILTQRVSPLCADEDSDNDFTLCEMNGKQDCGTGRYKSE